MSTIVEQALPPGTVVDSFEIKGVLGTGGFGITYKAYDRSLDCQVAIKEYFPAGLASRGENQTSIEPRTRGNSDAFEYGLKRFLDEARTLARFQEPSVVRVSRFLEANGTAYLVMDYEDGHSLADVITRLRRLNEKQATAVVVNILRGLRVVHAKKFLHRDIKPANIIVRRSGPPVLLDFGAARIALEEQAGGLTVMLTPGYAPIEQYSSEKKQGPWSDIYAMGGTAYHCITGRAPPPATDRLAQTHHGIPDPAATELAKLSDEYSPHFLDAITWMMELNEDERPRTAGQALAAILGRSPRPTGMPAGAPTLAVSDFRVSTAATAAPAVAPAALPELPADVLEEAQAHLAQFIGPIAKVFVQRVAPESESKAQLYEKLSLELEADEREEFLRQLPPRAAGG